MKKNNSSYSQSWDHFYSNSENSAPLWEKEISTDHIELLKQHFNRDLPIVDFGCGLGKDALTLSRLSEAIVGLDASNVVIEKNKKKPTYSHIEFRQFDGLDHSEAVGLHASLGDSNVYMRGVLHQIEPQHRPVIARSLKILLGQSGSLFIHEVDRAFFNTLNAYKSSELPLTFRKMLIAKHIPKGISMDEIETLFVNDERYEICESGKHDIKTNHQLKNGKQICVPTNYACIVKTGTVN